jgi:two-component system, OmpR family, phosphate regulon sensor histidine kinase PhoR
MFVLSTITLAINGATLALALCFLLILLWYDSQRRVIQFFAAFLLLVILWNAGSLLTQAMILGGINTSFSLTLMEIGFSGSSIALYAFTTVLIGTHTNFFRLLAFSSLVMVIAYRLLLIVNDTQNFESLENYRFQSFFFYFLFNIITLYLTWQYRRKIRSQFIIIGSVLFGIGQAITFLNPDIPLVSISTNVSAIGTLIIAIGIIQQEIMSPLSERATQAEAIHRVSLAISKQLNIETVLNEIAMQAAGWMEADAVGIFLLNEKELELVNLYHLPRQMSQYHIKVGEGVVGRVAETGQSIYLENYSRDWTGIEDLPLARQTFGSVICVPLNYGTQVIGTVMVIAGKQGRLFNQDDVHQLERLCAQASVAIAHSRLFRQVEEARNQLETLLISTDNPVLAIDRHFTLIFANPAAYKVFKFDQDKLKERIDRILPLSALPANRREALRTIRDTKGYTYEISLDSIVYLCHLAPIGEDKVDGWVAVMNDVTQLKELDRLKSEMVRMVSHDLKNPLMGAMLHLDLIRDMATPNLTEPLNTVERQLERMNRIIRGVLDLEQIRNGLKVSEINNLNDITQRAIYDLKHLAHDKHIHLSLNAEEDHLFFKGDPDQMERALTNLIENAIKFTPEGGRVEVSLKQSAECVVVEVRDTGIGIPEEMHQKVFERFFRGRQKGIEHVSGSGLGLSIVKTIIENHHGTITLSSDYGSGTTFTVYLPQAVPSNSYSH